MTRWTVLSLILCVLAAPASAGEGRPTFVDDFSGPCALGRGDSPDWKISQGLDRSLWASRVRCLAKGGAADPGAIRIEVHPKDAYNPDPTGAYPTERVEIQVRRELVRFDEPLWYRFRFRLERPWPVKRNRTVIHQVKQDIEPAWQNDVGGGPCPAANPFFKIEAGGDDSQAMFVVKTRGTRNCTDGKVAEIHCGPWPLEPERWYRVNVMLNASQEEQGARLRVWLDGRACPAFTGILGYVDHGQRNKAGKPIATAQPRFGIYRDALIGDPQAIDFADIAFWSSEPADPEWAALKPAASP
jgi:hypothetical protein